MRIISGKYKGRILKEHNIEGTRPTMDRIKESLFAMIQTKLPNSICLDLFCGSGSLGIEALSNNAKECYFVDNNKKIIEILKKNTFDIFKIKFDIIFLDPPYDMHLINKAIAIIEKENLLNENGLIVCEYRTEEIKANYSLYKEKKYGDKYIKIYINNQGMNDSKRI